MKLIVRKTFSYGGQRYLAGNAVYMPDKHAKVFMAIGKARKAEEKSTAPPIVKADGPKKTKPKKRTYPKKQTAKKRTYQRRDMRADEHFGIRDNPEETD